MMPVPAVQNEPENTSSPGALLMASDSPVKSDSSISSESLRAISPSTTSRSPGSTRIISSLTTLRIGTSIHFAVAQARDILLAQRRQSVKLAFGAEFLNHAEKGIGDHAETGEDRRGVVTKQDHADQQASQDDVEQIQDILAEDIPIAAPDTRLIVVAFAAAQALLHIGAAQPYNGFSFFLSTLDDTLHVGFDSRCRYRYYLRIRSNIDVSCTKHKRRTTAAFYQGCVFLRSRWDACQV